MTIKLCKYYLYAFVPLLFGLHLFVLKHSHIDSINALIDSFISTLLLVLSTFEVYLLVKYFSPRWSNGITILGILAIFSFIIVEITKHSFKIISPSYFDVICTSSYIRYAFVFIYLIFLTIVFYLTNEIKTDEAEESRKLMIEKMNKDAELFKLRHQLQPHFLFNSLNSISALAGSKPQEARLMIQQLSDFLRITLRKEEQDMVMLKDELSHLDLYLAIEKVRFGHRLITSYDIDISCENYKVPTLILQPIVENAIKFGLYDTLDETVITIKVKEEGNYLKITVENPYDFSTAVPPKGNGFGLKSIQRRLYLIFAQNNLLHTSKTENKFITTLLIPIIK